MEAEVGSARLALWGASGRMGEALLACLGASGGLSLVAAVVSEGSPWRGRLLSERFAAAPTTLRFVSAADCPPCDVLLDFSGAGGFRDALASAMRLGAAFVSGSTGLRREDEDLLEQASVRIPVLWAANFSLGMAALVELVERAAALLPDFEAELMELHHRGKRDAPSGTARALSAAVEWGKRGAGRAAEMVFHRTGARGTGEIGVASLRGGDGVGEHRLFLLGEGERLELAHQATDRRVFARGALRAARWLAGRPPGRYRLAEVLASLAGGPRLDRMRSGPV
jgi:4-hydroxy-tetrahydrodipicolinate reductase